MRAQAIVSGGLLASALALTGCLDDDAAETRATTTTGTETSLPKSGTEIPPARNDDQIKNGTETDVDCGGASAPACTEGKQCVTDADCTVACSEAHRCVEAPSCRPHLGGDTCGRGELDHFGADHESCCRTLPVGGYADPGHPGRAVYLDKYEITAGRVRAFLADIAAKSGGKADVRGYIATHTPAVWDAAWNKFLPSGDAAETVRVDRRLLGDRRGGLTAAIPAADQDLKVGVDAQFNGQLFVHLEGNGCSTHEGAMGFATWFYPASVMAEASPPPFPPRADGTTLTGGFIPASEHLEVKAMNCITNAMLAAFCHWDGGQLATDEVLDFVTASPPELGNMPGCGTQVGTENPPSSLAATAGGRCPALPHINATYDASGSRPAAESPLNLHKYMFPSFATTVTHDKAWQVSAPGRGSFAADGEPVDMVRMKPGDEPWMDLAGNLNEAVLDMNGATFTGKFGLKYRGIGYQSARSDLNMRSDWEGEGGVRRIERPEARAGYAGGRCMRFK